MAKKHNMNPDKSGVIIFFEPMLEEVDDLDDARLGQLYRATLHFAAGGGDPVFEDETLRHVWRFVRTLIIRDDKSYTKKVAGKQYGVYCRFAKEHHYTPLDREDWDALGGPTFKEWEKLLKSQTHTNVCDVCVCIPNSDSLSNSDSSSSATSAATPTPASDAAEPPDGGADAADGGGGDEWEEDKARPYEIPTLEQVERYCRQKGLNDTDPAEYYRYYENTGWKVGANSGNPRRMIDWKAHIRRWDSDNRKRAQSGANGGKGGPDAAETLRRLHEKFREEDAP